MSRRKGSGNIYRQSGCKTWTIRFYKDGKRIIEATGKSDYSAAQKTLTKRLREIDLGTFVEPSAQRIRVEELGEDFLRDYRINGRKSLQITEWRWAKHLKPYFGGMKASEVNSDTLARYVDARLKAEAQPATINREMAALKRMFRLGFYSTPPKLSRLPQFPRLEENNVRSGFVADSQVSKLTSSTSELWLRAFIEVALTYGWRKTELLSLRVRQIDLKQRTIRLDPGDTKNKEGREITMTTNVLTLLTQCVEGKKPEGYVFTRADGKQVKDFRSAWTKLCTAANVPDLLVHDMRRTGARNLRRAGVAEGVIMRIGGWRTRSVFERYNIVSQSDIKDALIKLEQHREEVAESSNGHDSGMIDPNLALKSETTETARTN